nr:DNA-primase RepB domain-containing protein [Edaphobacter modestus]
MQAASRTQSPLGAKRLGTFASQTLAERYDADRSAADWRRFGRLPGFTNCKPKYRKSDGLFPFVRFLRLLDVDIFGVICRTVASGNDDRFIN